MIENFFIKKNYIHRKENKTLDTNRQPFNKYWDKNRIEASYLYQYGVYNFLKNLILKNNLSNVLDIGCGVSTKLMKIIYPICKDVAGIDQKDPIVFSKKKYKKTSASFYIDNFEKPSLNIDKKFDVIVCCDVIEHLENPDVVLNYIKSFANVNTYIVISTPERDIFRGKDNIKTPDEDHIREWNSAEFKKYLESRGFKILLQKNLPSLKFSFKYPFIVQYFSSKIRGILNSNQLVLCKIK
ncbi:MAG: class I SAM-dependent methyltransferase [Nanoarchaeota archaeon]|nr:class I SAM-dependent methyltransferase [Nanoarchaeota archaeon]